MTTTYPGFFISFEGIDGAGKSTHVEAFRALMKSRYPNKEVVLTREPGGTPLGEQLRDLLLNAPMNLETEALLMFAARREHIAQVIEPTLAAGNIVISDRFTDASFAYQGGGRGMSIQRLNELERWVQGRPEGSLLQPNLTILFDLPGEIAEARFPLPGSINRRTQGQEIISDIVVVSRNFHLHVELTPSLPAVITRVDRQDIAIIGQSDRQLACIVLCGIGTA